MMVHLKYVWTLPKVVIYFQVPHVKCLSQYLVQLILSHNKVSQLQVTDVDGMELLDEFYADFNEISDVEEFTFANLVTF